MAFFENLRSFVWGDEDDYADYADYAGGSVYGARDGSVFQGDSICTSTYGARGSVLEASHAVARPAAGIQETSTGPYQARKEDPIDVKIAEYFHMHPEVYTMHRGFARISPGRYLAHGREITVEQHNDLLKGLQLIVVDGPLRQPLADYLSNQDSSAQYSGSVFQTKNALQTIPQASRMTFADTGARYSRIEAMKVAKEQANFREQAAAKLNQGELDFDLRAKYEKTIDRKLGKKQKETPDKAFPNLLSPSFSPGPALPPPGLQASFPAGTGASPCFFKPPPITGSLQIRPGAAVLFTPRAGGV